MVHLIVAITGAHRAPDLPLAAAVALWPSSGCRSRSRSWMCQYHRFKRKSWRLLLVRSSATVVQASGDSTGGRAHIEQIVDVPVPRILEQNVEVIKVIPQEQCQRMRFFTFYSVWEGAVGGTFHTCCPTAHSHTRGLILSASDGIWNMWFSTYSHTSHWVRFSGCLMLFSTYLHTFKRVRSNGCLSPVVAHVRPTH